MANLSDLVGKTQGSSRIVGFSSFRNSKGRVVTFMQPSILTPTANIMVHREIIKSDKSEYECPNTSK
jgi:hypothetical protein